MQLGDGGLRIKDVLPYSDIIVCTSGKLANEIIDELVTFNGLGLLVIDECHHACKKEPYAIVMEKYMEHKKKCGGAGLPQATPGAGDNPTLNKDKTIDHLISLCTLMDAASGTVVVRENVVELDQFSPKPIVTLKTPSQHDPAEEFIRIIIDEMTRLEKLVDLGPPCKKLLFNKKALLRKKS